MRRPWWAKFAGAVGSSTVVVPNVVCEHHTQVPLIEDQHAVGEFGSDCPHEPFGEAVRPWATRRNPDHADAHIGQDGVERRGELTGPVSDEEPELGEAIIEIHGQVADLLGGPPAVWIRGGAQHVHGPVADLQDEEHVDPREGDCAVYVEEVTRQHGRRLGAEELSPGRVGVPDRRWRDPQPLQDAADRRCPNAMTELEQLALNSLISPAGVLPGHALDQHGQGVLDRWTAEAVGIGPFLGDEVTMPAQDCARRDQAMPPQHRRQPPDERGEDRSIRPVQAGFGVALRSTATS